MDSQRFRYRNRPLHVNGLGVAIVLALSGGGQKTPTYFQQFVPHPTGANAYEDYVRAADLATGPEFDVLLTWTPKQADQYLESERAEQAQSTEKGDIVPAPPLSAREKAEAKVRREMILSLKGADYVSVDRLLLQRFGAILDAIRVGNGKPYLPPPPIYGPTTTFPILARYKAVARFANAVAYYQFAAGESGKATSTLLDSMTFAHRISKGILIEHLVGIACTAIANSGFNERLQSLSDADALKIVKYCDQTIAEPMALDAVVEAERVNSLQMIDAMLSAKQPSTSEPSDPEDESPMERAAKKWSPAEKDRFRQAFLQASDSHYKHWILVLRTDEAHLLPQLSPMDENVPDPSQASGSNPEAIAEMLASINAPVWTQMVVATMKNRTQIRLLGLHARIIDFRWKNKRLPTKLEECASASAITDPLSGESFVYETGNGAYELFSKGAKETGRIDLKYKREAIGPAAGIP